MLNKEELGWLFPHVDTVEAAVFRLTRFIKHNRGLLMQAERPFVNGIVSAWIQHARNVYPNGAIDTDDVMEQIRTNWPRAAYPLGIDPIAEAVHQARDTTEFPAAPFDYGETHALIFRCLYWLNVYALKRQQSTWFVSTYALGKRLGIRQTIIHRAVKRMVRDGHVTIAEHGTQYRANRYETRLVTV